MYYLQCLVIGLEAILFAFGAGHVKIQIYVEDEEFAKRWDFIKLKVNSFTNLTSLFNPLRQDPSLGMPKNTCSYY